MERFDHKIKRTRLRRGNHNELTGSAGEAGQRTTPVGRQGFTRGVSIRSSRAASLHNRAMKLIDTHCHLNDPNFSIPVEEAVRAARAAGVVQMVVPGMNMPTTKRAVELAAQFPGTLFAAVGLHPHNVYQRTPGLSDETLSELWSLAKQDGVVAVGEIGMDYHHYEPTDENRERQQQAFAAQLELSLEERLPAIVHGREAYADVLDVIRAYPGSTGVLHSFEAPYEVARAAFDLGWLISLTALVTYPNYDWLRDVVRQVPLELLMLETDSPYLPPQAIRNQTKERKNASTEEQVGGKVVGARGRNNQPQYVLEVAKVVAEVKGIELAEVARVTTETARELFRLPETT